MAPLISTGFTVASGDIPRFSSTTGHLQSTGYNATNTIPGNFIQPFGSGNSGAVPSSGGGTANFLRADGTWAPATGSSGTPVLGFNDQTGLTSNAVQASGTMYTLSASPTYTYYEVCFNEVVTTAATTSSTLPNPAVKFTDSETGVVVTESILVAGSSTTANTVGTVITGCGQIHAQAGSVIYGVSGGYNSSGATVMAYSFHGTVIGLR
jgi:hypothetical protein